MFSRFLVIAIMCQIVSEGSSSSFIPLLFLGTVHIIGIRWGTNSSPCPIVVSSDISGVTKLSQWYDFNKCYIHSIFHYLCVRWILLRRILNTFFSVIRSCKWISWNFIWHCIQSLLASNLCDNKFLVLNWYFSSFEFILPIFITLTHTKIHI